jgi:hypothetical protein
MKHFKVTITPGWRESCYRKAHLMDPNPRPFVISCPLKSVQQQCSLARKLQPTFCLIEPFHELSFTLIPGASLAFPCFPNSHGYAAVQTAEGATIFWPSNSV